jgi:hypothetical protein
MGLKEERGYLSMKEGVTTTMKRGEVVAPLGAGVPLGGAAPSPIKGWPSPPLSHIHLEAFFFPSLLLHQIGKRLAKHCHR